MNSSNQDNRLKTAFLTFQRAFPWCAVGIGALGIMGNILVLRVVTKRGFGRNRIHLSYITLAVLDLCCILASVACGFTTMDVFLRQFDKRTGYRLSALIGGLPHVAFSRTTGLVTAWITLERCLCVVFPTRVKIMITRRVTRAVLVAITTIGCAPMACVYAYVRFDLQVESMVKNSTISTFAPDVDRDARWIQDAVLLLYGLFYPLFSWVSVTACTAVLVTTLRQRSKWRGDNLARCVAETSTGHRPSANVNTSQRKQAFSAREHRITKVVIMTAGLFIVCSTPMSVNLMARVSLPEYSRDGLFRYLFLVNGMVVVLLTQLNSSLNTVIFTLSGQKFRGLLLATLAAVICKH